LTLDKEKPIVEQTSASSIDQIVPNCNPASNNLAEQRPSLAGGQGKKKKADTKSSGLTGAKTGLTGVPSKVGNSSGTKDKKRLSFKELLAKYEKNGATQKQKEPSNKVKDTKPSSERQERSGQGNYASSNGPIAPWYCWCPYFYTSMDYSRMHMQSYYIQYPSIYPNHASPQRPIVASNNLVKKDVDCSKEVEKSAK